MASIDLFAGTDGLHTVSGGGGGGSGSDLNLTTADSTQDGLAQVTSTAADGTGTYTWTLKDPNGVDRTALLSATDTASVTWTPTDINGADWCAGTWVAACTDGTVEVKHLVRIGDEDGYIYQDLSACTLRGRTGLYDSGASSLGLTSTVVIGADHGGADGADGATLMQMVQRPTDAVILDQRMKLTYSTSGTDSATAMIELCNIPESESGAQVGNHGYHGGFAIDSADDVKQRGPTRFGGLGSLSAAFAGSAGYAELTTVFDEGAGTLKGDEVWLSCYDTGTNPGVQHYYNASVSSGSYRDGIHIGIVLSHIDGSIASPPTATITWTNVRVGWRWRQQT
jgi:hypothetical protein